MLSWAAQLACGTNQNKLPAMDSRAEGSTKSRRIGRQMKIKNCFFTVQVLSSWTFGQVKSCFWKAAGKNSRKKLSIPAAAALCTTETRLLSWGQLHTNVTWVMEFSDVYFGLHIISKQIPFMHHHNPLSIINSQQK